MKRLVSRSGLTWCDLPEEGQVGRARLALFGILTDCVMVPDCDYPDQPDTVVDIVIGGQPYRAEGWNSTCRFDIDDDRWAECSVWLQGRQEEPAVEQFVFNVVQKHYWTTAEVIRAEVDRIDPAANTMPWFVLADWLREHERNDLADALVQLESPQPVEV